MAKPLCIYHGNCADGFGAAWVVWRRLKGEVDFYPGVYQKPPPDVTGRDVILVDFSYKRPVLEEMATQAHSIVVLDHHKTAQDDLVASGRFIRMFNATYEGFLGNVEQDRIESAGTQVYSVFDMKRSGCGITWDFFNPGIPRPKLIDHLEDRDIWRFALPGTREIQASMFSLPYDFGLWNTRFERFDYDPELRQEMLLEGAAIERKHFKDIHELVEVVTRLMKIGGYIVPVANLPYTLTSDAGHLLCQASGTFAGCYWDTPDGRQFSLRSDRAMVNWVDVGEIAKQYGGGGHPNASGFRVPFDQLAQFEVTP